MAIKIRRGAVINKETSFRHYNEWDSAGNECEYQDRRIREQGGRVDAACIRFPERMEIAG